MRWQGFWLLLIVVSLGCLAMPTAVVAERLMIDGAAIESEQKRFESQAGVKAPCAMPRPSDGAKVVLLRASAESLSTVTIGSQDVATKTGAIVVDAGEQPLYLIVVSHAPTIWRVSGVTGRIERLVMAALMTGPNRGVPGQVPLIGETGIARDRVTFLQHPHCLRLYEPSITWIDSVDHLLKHQLGRENVRRGDFGVAISEVSVPSFAYRSLRRHTPMVVYNRRNSSMMVEGDPTSRIIIEGRNDLDEELRIFTPGGVTQIDAQVVVASRPVEPYAVLPQQAGLIQLIQSGALSRDEEGDFIIERKIRLPAELNSGHRFRLRRGIPPPDGDSGRTCILVEDTGAALDGSRC